MRVERISPEAQEACVALLSNLCNKREQGDELQQLSAAAQALFLALPGDTKRFPDLKPWQQQKISAEARDILIKLISLN